MTAENLKLDSPELSNFLMKIILLVEMVETI